MGIAEQEELGYSQERFQTVRETPAFEAQQQWTSSLNYTTRGFGQFPDFINEIRT